jgi:hypothetical protein
METQIPPAAPLPGLSMGALGSVFQAIGGLRNRQAAVGLLGCLFIGVLVAGLAGATGGFGAALGALVLFVAVGTGVNAAGVLLMDQARGAPARALVDALVYGLMCVPKLILLGLVLLAIEIAVFIVIALVFLLCKIPFLGAVLYVVAFPAAVVIAGLTVFGLFLSMVLALPAIWEGLTVTRALAQTLAIARSRPVEAIVLLLAVGLLCLVVGFIVFGILGAGLVPAIGLSFSIIGGGAGGFAPMMGMMEGGGFTGGSGGGHAIAAVIGGGLLWAIAATLVGQVYLLGLAIVYLRVTEGLDVGAAQAALQRGLEDAKRRTAQIGERARAAAQRATATAAPRAGADSSAAAAAAAAAPAWPIADAEPPARASSTRPDAEAPARASSSPQAATPAPTAAPVGASPTLPCPKCAAPCTADDLFCGTCGQRLR